MPATAVLSGVLLAGCGTPGSGAGGAELPEPGPRPGTATAPPVDATPSTPSPTPDESPASPGATATPSPAPTNPAEPTNPPEPPRPTVQLSPDGGVGHLMAGSTGGTADALPALVTLLGEPDSVTDGTCYLDFITTASWGDLNVDLNGGTLWGWSIVGESYPERVTTPYGIRPGDHLSDAVAATGVQPVLDEQFAVFRVQDGGMQWWAPAEEGPDGHIAVVAYTPVSCG